MTGSSIDGRGSPSGGRGQRRRFAALMTRQWPDAAARKRSAAEHDAYAMFTGWRRFAGTAIRALERVRGPPGWRWLAGLTDGRAALGVKQRDEQCPRHGRRCGCPISPRIRWPELRAGRRGTSFSTRQWRHRPPDLFPGRRLHSPMSVRSCVSGALAYGWQDVTTQPHGDPSRGT